MARLTPEQKKLMNNLMIAHPDWSDTKIAEEVGTTHVTIGKYRKNLQSETTAIVQYDARKEAKELTETFTETINEDIAHLRNVAIEILNKAVETKDYDLLETWWDKVQANASLRISMNRTFVQILGDVDARQVHQTTINVEALGDAVFTFLKDKNLLEEFAEYVKRRE